MPRRAKNEFTDSSGYRWKGISMNVRMMMFSGLKSIGNTYSNALNIIKMPKRGKK
jgi:hypothetical protein